MSASTEKLNFESKYRFLRLSPLVIYGISVFFTVICLLCVPWINEVCLTIAGYAMFFGACFALLAIMITLFLFAIWYFFGPQFRPKRARRVILVSITLTIINFVTFPLWGQQFHRFNSFFNRYIEFSDLAAVLANNGNKKAKILPPADSWCDFVVEKAGYKIRYALEFMSKGTKAFNENISGFEYLQLPGNVVLLFEAEGPWNLHGSEDLFIQHSKEANTVFILFVDGTIGEYKYSNGKLKLYTKGKAKDYLPLRWKP